jgi:putative ABC transport system permease protein
MISNYIKTAMRSAKKTSVNSIIHILGFSIGIACFIIILLWVQNELSYDNFHKNGDDLYRVLVSQSSATFAPLAQALRDELPEAVDAARYRPIGGRLLKYGDKALNKNRFCVVDPSFFRMFSFSFIKGSPSTALNSPDSIVLTEETAKKLFGEEDPMGKTLKVEDRFDFKVTGVLENTPLNSHMSFDVLAPFPFISALWGENLESWGGASHLTYVQLRKGSRIPAVSQKISEIVARHIDKKDVTMALYPVRKLHLAAFPMWLDTPQGSMRYVYLFTAAAFFLLIIACINFLNLTSARGPVRAREVGVRKVVGASQKNLITQFLLESILFSTLSLLLALVFVMLLLPAVNNVLGQPLNAGVLLRPLSIAALAGIALLTGLLSGGYPAFVLSSFRPSRVLKGSLVTMGKKRFPLRVFLVITQFVLTIFLLVGAQVVTKQLKFIRNYDLGFEKENIISMPLTGSLLRRLSIASNELDSNPDILSLSLTSTLPGRNETTTSTYTWEGKDPDELVRFEIIWADLGFQETFELEFLQGHYFSRERMTELRSGVVVNEAAVQAMGLTAETAIGGRLIDTSNGGSGQAQSIIGVVKNFHSRSLHYEIRPLVLLFARYAQDNLSIRIRAGKVPETLNFLGGIWAKYAPDQLLDFRFFDDILDDFYRAEQRMGRLFNLFALIAIVTSCLGLFGLSANMAERRTKEIGIRKTFGASEAGIVQLLLKDFVILLVAANVIALPASYVFMSRWLRNFAFRIDTGLLVYLMSGGIVFLIAAGTVAYQSFKASRADPIQSLRYE